MWNLKIHLNQRFLNQIKETPPNLDMWCVQDTYTRDGNIGQKKHLLSMLKTLDSILSMHTSRNTHTHAHMYARTHAYMHAHT